MHEFISKLIEEKISRLLTEAADRLEFLRNTYKNIPEQHFTKIVLADPTTKSVDGHVVKAGSYSQWLLKHYKNILTALGEEDRDRFVNEDLYKYTDALKMYDKVKNKLEKNLRDINNIKSYGQLYRIIEPYKEEQDKHSNKIEKSAALKILYEDSDYLIMQPLTKEASIKNFHHPITHWCTADSRDQYNQFDTYNQMGPLYVIKFLKSGDLCQFHFETGQFMDSDDSPINFKDFIKHNPIVGNVLFSEIAKNLSSDSFLNLQDVKQRSILYYLITLNFDLFLETFPEYIQKFISNVTCESSAFLMAKLRQKYSFNINCPDIKFDKDKVIYTMHISDLINIVFSGNALTTVKDFFDGKPIFDFNFDTISTKEIFNYFNLNSESLIKLKESIEKENEEDNFSIDVNDIEETLINNEDQYPKTINALHDTYNQALESAAYKNIFDHIKTTIGDWFQHETILEMNHDTVKFSHLNKTFYEIIDNIDTNSDDFIKTTISEFVNEMLGHFNMAQRSIYNIDFEYAINSAYINSKEFNETLSENLP